MTVIDWAMEHPYMTAALVAYGLAVIMSFKGEITLRIGERKHDE